MGILILIVPVLLLWLLFIRPQQRRVKEQQALVHAAGVGDVVVTAGGFVVTIMDSHDPDDDSNGLAADEVLVAFNEDVEVVMLRRSIAQIREQWDGVFADGTSIDHDELDGPVGELQDRVDDATDVDDGADDE